MTKPLDQMQAQCPTEPGFYWAKSKEDWPRYDLIVEICGEVPYLYWKAIRFRESAERLLYPHHHEGHPSNFIFGPLINLP